MSNEPRTAAGRRMLASHLYWGEWYEHNWLSAILAIEAGAEASQPAGLREALEIIAGINENRVNKAQADALGYLDTYLAATAASEAHR